jgi:uncharacterized SAM-binding protein YcdF (DUF218 family)
VFYDAIIVLGLHMPGGVPPDELTARVRVAAQCWIDGRAPAVIPCGGQREDEPFPEARWMAEQLSRMGLPISAIHPETESLNTEQNLRGAQRIIMGWGGTSALIVTSESHMRRALAVCRDIGLQARGVPVRTAGGRVAAKARVTEALGWIEYKLGMQRGSASHCSGESGAAPPSDKMGFISRLIRKATRS